MFLFSFNPTAPTDIYTLSLHDALPICLGRSHWTADPAVEIGFLFPDDLACDRRVVGAAINRSVRDSREHVMHARHSVDVIEEHANLGVDPSGDAPDVVRDRHSRPSAGGIVAGPHFRRAWPKRPRARANQQNRDGLW